MLLLILFSFLAGIVTILSPCILPVLPIILSSSIGGKNIGRSRALGVVTGFIGSFTFFTLFLSTLVKLSGIPAESMRFISIIVIMVFGLSMLIPKFQIYMEILFSKLSGRIPRTDPKSGFIPGLLVGLSLGLLWTPCVGPILASVISLAITGSVNLNAFFITLAYSLGTAIPMFAIILGGQTLLRKIPGLLTNTHKIQKAFGVVMILTAIAIFFNLDRRFQTFILNTFPSYGTNLTTFEDIQPVRDALDKLQGKDPLDSDMGKPLFELQPKGRLAPELIQGGSWIGSTPLTIKSLKGKVVLIDFWTYSCINCQRTFPYLRKWHEKYSAKNLVIIGVHSPEFEFEKDLKNLNEAVEDFAIKYPVMQDNDFATWFAYDNHYWPAKYLIDKEGYIRYSHFGEGAYDETEKIIQELLMETGANDVNQTLDNPTYQNYSRTHEKYLGYVRIEDFSSAENISKNKRADYTVKSLKPSEVAFEGRWLVADEYASPQKGAYLHLNFEAKEVFLVMNTIKDENQSQTSEAKVRVYLDDKLQYFGEDNNNGIVTVTKDTLYKLINLPIPGRHILKLEFLDDNARVYAFTFG